AAPPPAGGGVGVPPRDGAPAEPGGAAGRAAAPRRLGPLPNASGNGVNGSQRRQIIIN
ncbi:unnamed protein product, partial [Heterosigma akashiwo]